MSVRWKWKKRLVAAAVALVVAAGALALALFGDCDICQAANQIILQGRVADNCAIEVTSAAAAGNLPLTTAGTQRVQVGTVKQTCNKKAGYTLSVSSANCATAPLGGKLVDPAPNERLAYTAEFTNPTTGGSQPSVPNLLATACTGQTGRDVSNAKISDETSTVFVSFTGSTTLAAGTYQDTLTITLNAK